MGSCLGFLLWSTQTRPVVRLVTSGQKSMTQTTWHSGESRIHYRQLQTVNLWARLYGSPQVSSSNIFKSEVHVPQKVKWTIECLTCQNWTYQNASKLTCAVWTFCKLCPLPSSSCNTARVCSFCVSWLLTMTQKKSHTKTIEENPPVTHKYKNPNAMPSPTVAFSSVLLKSLTSPHAAETGLTLKNVSCV